MFAANGQPNRWGTNRPLLAVAKWHALTLALVLSLVAATVPILDPAKGWLAYAVAGVAIIAGVVAVGLMVVGRGRMLEAVATAVFLSIATVLFTINLVASVNSSKAAADAVAKATIKEGEVRQEPEKAEADRTSAAEMLKKADEAVRNSE